MEATVPRATRKGVASTEQVAARRDQSRCSAPVDPYVCDNFPAIVPVTRGEVEVIETFLGKLIDGLIGGTKPAPGATPKPSNNPNRRRRRAGASP